MDNTLAQIINDLITANQEIARLRQENDELRKQPPAKPLNGEAWTDPLDTMSTTRLAKPASS